MSTGKVVLYSLGGLALVFILSVVLGVCNTAVTMVDSANKAVIEQFSPEVLLKKYEWFKDASAALDAKLANLEDYRHRYLTIKEGYGADSSNRAKWSRGDKEQWNTWQSEEAGVKASYNDLAAQYNAEMVKFNYRFCNVGELPKGADKPVPREYRSYI